MPDDKKMLSVSEFAKKAGISRQWVYSLLDKKLSTYCQRVDSKIMIDSSALSLFTDNGLTVNLTDALDTVYCQLDTDCQVVDNMEIDKLHEQIRELTAELKKAQQVNTDQTLTIERLTGNCERMRQTAEQDRQRAAAADAERKRADAAEAQLTVKDQQITAQNERLAELTAALQSAQRQAESLTEALTAAQALHAGTLQRIGEKPSQEPVNAQESPQEAEHEDAAPTTAPPPRSSQKTAAEPAGAAPSGSEAGDRKRGIFSRLFRKHK